MADNWDSQMVLENQRVNIKIQKHVSKTKDEFRERCFRYSVAVIGFIKTLPEDRVHRRLSGQLLRAATNIGANVTEANASSSKREFIRYFEIGLKSANETVYWLELLKEGLKVNRDEVGELLQETRELSKILAASLMTMKGRTT